MESLPSFLVFFSLAMVVFIIEARPDSGECWQNLIVQKSEYRRSATDFEPRPSAISYVTGVSDKKSYDTKFEPRPSATSYVTGLNGKKTLNIDFEPRPSATSYVTSLNG
ncbi:putative organ specific protein [Helianthus annuus]|uniref:Organ specific protein n=2 Tax=Helianthus annuus TaxID=4232 RepID=A0A9K3NTT8_HELAN|nr:putative organ specific protein [Helianthus annuus]